MDDKTIRDVPLDENGIPKSEIFSSPMGANRDDHGTIVTDHSGKTKRTSNIMFGYNRDGINLENGEIIALSNNKKYICMDSINSEEIEYVYLLGNFKPAEVKFGIVKEEDNNLFVEIVNNPDQKKKILNLFQQKI